MQVYYYYKGNAHPFSCMPKPLQLFYDHLRHAGPTSLWLILWVHPVMTVDRFLLAVMFSFYLAVAYHVSVADFRFAQTFFALQEICTTTKHRSHKD